MDSMSSAEFRKTYARLTNVTRVTVNGHLIGEWTPMGLSADIIDGQLQVVRDPERTRTRTHADPQREPMGRMTQTERDAILRKVRIRGND